MLHRHSTELQKAAGMSRRRFKILAAVAFWLVVGCLCILYNVSSYGGSFHDRSVVRGEDDLRLNEDRDFDQFVDFRVQPQVNRPAKDLDIDAIVRRNKEIDKRKREELLGSSNFAAEMKQRNMRQLPGNDFAKDGSSFQLGKGVVTYPVKSPNTTELVLLDPQEAWLQAERENASARLHLQKTVRKAGNDTKSALGHAKAWKSADDMTHFQNRTRLTNRTSVDKQYKQDAQDANKFYAASGFASGAKGLGRGKEKYPRRTLVEKTQPEQSVDRDSNVLGKDAGVVKKAGLPSFDTNASHKQFTTDFPDMKHSNQSDDLVFNSSYHGKFVVSMTLYGDAVRYTVGAMRNAELIQRNFPGWTLRIYTEMPSDEPKFGLVPQDMINLLRSAGADIQYMVTKYDPIPPMMWRFLVADDPAVERFIIRDADARLTERDAAAVQAWIESGEAFNCIRDHPSHAGYAISGGLWGGWTPKMRRLIRHTWREMMLWQRKSYLEDMNFLNNKIWPMVEKHAYCSDSVSCDKWPGSHPFPVARYGYEHVGQVMDQHDLGRPQDVSILRNAGENSKCVPQTGQLLGRLNRH